MSRSVAYSGHMFQFIGRFLPKAFCKEKSRSSRFTSLWERLAVSAGLSLSLVLSVSLGGPVQAAEQVRMRYGLYELLITAEDLSLFARTGEAQGDLRTLVSRLGSGRAAQLQGALQATYELDPVLANRFAYTRSGEQLLTAVGELIRTESGQNGFKALRAALTLAAGDPDGLSMLSFLEHFPSEMRIDIGDALRLADEYGSLLGQTQAMVNRLAIETDAVATGRVDFSRLPDPRLPGEVDVVVRTFEFYDATRDRTIPLDIYLPDDAVRDLPIVVVSNGLGAKRDRFEGLARHLASQGFAMVLLDHPGSDRERLQDFYRGFESENFEPGEYVDRPLDVSFVLDELTRLNSQRFEGRLNLEQTGVFGYSFGGTTALALAGAEIELDHLRTSCETRSSLFNISLLYQCRALELDEGIVTSRELRDDRIQAAYVFVPFSRSLYGPEGMAQVEGPVLWEATDQDILTPFLVEQVPAFSWLEDDVEERYLTVTSGLPHARITLEVLGRLTGEGTENWEEIRAIADGYHQTLALAFFKVHLAGDEQYRAYLQPEGAKYLTQEPYRLTWSDSFNFEEFVDIND